VSTTYIVRAGRSDDQWTADVAGVPQARAWAPNLDALNARVHELIANLLGLPSGAEADLDLAWTF
jgi:hypothetical protein